MCPRKNNGTDHRRVVSTFDLPPLQGESLWAAVPRVETWLKPWAESSSPFGARPFGPVALRAWLLSACSSRTKAIYSGTKTIRPSKRFALSSACAFQPRAMYTSRKKGGNLENAVRWCERNTGYQPMLHLAFRTVERSPRAFPGAIAVHLE
jgi:hypothetical protein